MDVRTRARYCSQDNCLADAVETMINGTSASHSLMANADLVVRFDMAGNHPSERLVNHFSKKIASTISVLFPVSHRVDR